jgi:GMP synthase (glutamine-hydrolysing)
MKVVVLRCGDAVPSVAERRGEFFGWIQVAAGNPSGTMWSEIDVRTAAPELADAIVITGSASSVTERAPWMLRTEEFLRVASAANVPILGICFGHQLLGQALGGRVEKNSVAARSAPSVFARRALTIRYSKRSHRRSNQHDTST